MHSYFASGSCETVAYHPSVETKKMMDTYGLLMRKMPNGFQIYTSTSQSIETYINYITQVTGIDALKFNGTATEQAFYNYTAQIPLNEIGMLSYTNTHQTNTPVLLQETFISQSSTNDILQITITFEDIVQAQKTGTDLAYQIQFTARETQWNYYIINTSNQNYHEIAIQSSTEEIQFSNKGETTLQNGQKAILFSSGTLLSLKDIAQHKFDLINTKQTIAGNRKETIFKGLPIPNASNLQLLDNSTIASPMYVYI